LGLWIEQTEGAKFWLRVMNELRKRAAWRTFSSPSWTVCRFSRGDHGTFPECVVQTRIAHLIQPSLQFVSWKERKALTQALKPTI